MFFSNFGGLKGQTVRKLNRKSIENIAKNDEIWYNKNVRNTAVMHIWREFYAIYKRRKQRSVNVASRNLEDYVTEDNPVRVIDAFVDGLDIKSMGFTKHTPSKDGRPGYDPRDMLKLCYSL